MKLPPAFDKTQALSGLKTKNLLRKDAQAASSSAAQKPRISEEMKRLFPGLYAGKTSSSNIKPKADIQKEIQSDPERKRLYGAAQDFQAIFIGQMLKAMRRNLNPKSDPLYGGNRQKIFEDMLYDEYAKGISKTRGFDLADQIYEQLSASMGEPKTAASKANSDSNSLDNRFIPGQADSHQKYASERLRRQIEEARNKISTSELYKEGDWRP